MKLSMSGLEAAYLCPVGPVLPQVFREHTAASTRGVVLHKFLSDVPTLGKALALEQVPEDFRRQCEVIELDALPLNPQRYVPELALAYNWVTGEARELGRGIDRRYDGLVNDALEIPGTPDVVGDAEDEDAAIVGDYKTGFHDYGPVFDMWQLRAYGLAAARWLGRSRAVGFLIRIRPDGTPYFERATWEAEDLAETAEAIVDLVDRVQRAEDDAHARRKLDVRTGPHCGRCRAFANCPAQAQLVRHLTAAVDKAPPEAFAMLTGHHAMTDESALAAYGLIDRIREIADQIEGSLKTYTDVRPLEVGKGKLYGPVPWPSEKIDPQKAPEVIRKMFPAQLAEKVLARAVQTKTTISKEGLTEGLRHVVEATPGAKITKVVENTLGKLRDEGAATTTWGKQYREHTPKKKAKAEGGQNAA